MAKYGMEPQATLSKHSAVNIMYVYDSIRMQMQVQMQM